MHQYPSIWAKVMVQINRYSRPDMYLVVILSTHSVKYA